MQDYITVSALNGYIKKIFDNEELLHNIPLLGEVYGVSFSRNVIYFSLKDENASISCVCFYPAFAEQIVEGAKLVCYGSPNFYTKAGKLNFNVNRVETLGQGKLYEQFLALKSKLEKEGLFDKENKKALPKKIERIGVITSKEGAVIQDIKNVAWRRNPYVDIVLYNTKVQGQNAENEIAKAIEIMGQYKNIDVIIVARGGGSLEDLSAYNTEIVARAVYNCPKPVVSAVGHETDFTIIDFVSDLRAPTPSAAAELVTTNMEAQSSYFVNLKNRFLNLIEDYVDEKKSMIYNISISCYDKIEKDFLKKKLDLSSNAKKLESSVTNYLNNQYYQIGLIENTLKKINPQQILKQGYAKIEQQGISIKKIGDVNYANDLSIFLQDGKIIAKPLKEK